VTLGLAALAALGVAAIDRRHQMLRALTSRPSLILIEALGRPIPINQTRPTTNSRARAAAGVGGDRSGGAGGVSLRRAAA
jgi:hypothetical protein